MPSFEDTLARMKGLYTYGNEVNESNNLKTHTLEHRAVAADGITYGIIRENSKYYIKSAPKGKETIAEAYDYLGGFCNKSNYEYSSYAKALKQFELKLASINEAMDSAVNVESLNPFRANEVLAEASQAMKDEIARQRQIMYNAAMLMNESIEIGASRKDNVVKFDGKNPEAETGKKGDEGNKETKAQPEYAGSHIGLDKKAEPFKETPGATKDQLKEGEDIGDAPLHPNTENWGTEGIGKGRDPKQVGWEMDGQQTVNEEEDDWASKGLPSAPGVGEADTDHNNDPFNNSINEGDELDDEPKADAEGEDFGTDIDGAEDSDDDLSTDTDLDAGVNDLGDEGEGEDIDLGDEEDGLDLGDDEGEGADDVDIDNEPVDGGEDEDLRAQIEDLQAKLDALRAQLDGEGADAGEDASVDGEDVDFPDGEDFEDVPTDYEGEEDAEGDFESDFEDGIDGEGLDGEGEDFEDSENADTLGDDDDLDECGDGSMAPMGGDPSMMSESKKAFMNSIVESVVKDILSEDELHVFGKHPGYRKKPMELPTTGEDKNQWGEDWNDESVHNEEPFGSKIGNGDPFNQLVNTITKNVIAQIKNTIPIEGADKKKA